MSIPAQALEELAERVEKVESRTETATRESHQATSALGRLSREVAGVSGKVESVGGKVDACILEVRTVQAAQRHLADGVNTLARDVREVLKRPALPPMREREDSFAGIPELRDLRDELQKRADNPHDPLDHQGARAWVRSEVSRLKVDSDANALRKLKSAGWKIAVKVVEYGLIGGLGWLLHWILTKGGAP